MAGPTREFWEQRFATGETPWDRGEANPQLGAWIAAGALKPCRILVPGCGSGYEVAEFAMAGFEVTALDYASEAIGRTRQRRKAAGARATLVEADALAPCAVRVPAHVAHQVLVTKPLRLQPRSAERKSPEKSQWQVQGVLPGPKLVRQSRRRTLNDRAMANALHPCQTTSFPSPKTANCVRSRGGLIC